MRLSWELLLFVARWRALETSVSCHSIEATGAITVDVERRLQLTHTMLVIELVAVN